MNPAEGVQSFLEFVITSLVRHPDQAFVRSEIVDGTTVYNMQAADEDDTRKILGKEDRGLSALRNLAGAAAAQHGLKIRIELKGEGEPRKRRFIPPRRK
jgi:predicted RNA-binding protein YlqC (UPF0109 family)